MNRLMMSCLKDNSLAKYMYFSELLFVVYLALAFNLKDKYFDFYKLLYIPALILNFILVYKKSK